MKLSYLTDLLDIVCSIVAYILCHTVTQSADLRTLFVWLNNIASSRESAISTDSIISLS
jgi:hypothetical protein